MYRLEYRLLPDHPENVVLTEGMKMEDGWITEWGSAGQPYILLYYDEYSGKMLWRGIDVLHTEFIESEYGTPDMLKRYGDAYTAAAAELGREYMNSHISGTEKRISNLFGEENDIGAVVYAAEEAVYIANLSSDKRAA